MAEPTVEEVLKLDPEKVKEKEKHSSLGAIIAFFLFAPLGVYLLWKEKTFHSTFAVLTLIVGLGYLISTVLSFWIGSHYLILATVLFLSCLQVGYSFYLYKKAKKRGFLEVVDLTVLATFVILVDFVIIPILLSWLVVALITPYFNQTLDQNQIYQQFPQQY
ncbi:MAG TPA: hypothetical protein VLE47_04600 [Candidatus Saccharimonadales bacterium]|nr:hypothetical protein [Candidatus Saccharimonadales bacterium]